MLTRREQDEKIVAQLQAGGEYWYFASDAGSYYDMVGIVHDGKVIRMPMPKAAGMLGVEVQDEYEFAALVGIKPVMSMTVKDEIVYSQNPLGEVMAQIASGVQKQLGYIIFVDGTAEIRLTDTEVPVGQVPNLRATYKIAPHGVYVVEHDGNPYDYNTKLFFMPSTQGLDIQALFTAAAGLV